MKQRKLEGNRFQRNNRKINDYPKMSVEEIHERWPSTVELPEMTDDVLDRILVDMAYQTQRWLDGSPMKFIGTVAKDMHETDERLGIRANRAS